MTTLHDETKREEANWLAPILVYPYGTDRREVLTAASRIAELSAALGEANAEIDRHHRDFKRISDILDDCVRAVNVSNSVAQSSWACAEALKRIRNIVG